MFKEKYKMFTTKVDILEDVIKVSLVRDTDKELGTNPYAITRCTKCKTGILEVRPFAKTPVLGCNKCDKQVVIEYEADKLEKVPQRCHKCERYMVNVK